MKRTLYRITAVITALAFLITVQAAYEDRIPKNVVYAAIITMAPGSNTETTESTGATESTEASESSESTESTGASESSESTESTGASENGESTESTGVSESGESTESTGASESGESTESTGTNESGESTESTGASESSEATESSEASEGSEATESSEASESSEATESSEASESSEATESSEASESSEATKSSEASESNEATESSEASKSSEPAERVETAESSEAEESSAASENTQESVVPQPPQKPTQESTQESSDTEVIPEEEASVEEEEEDNPWIDVFQSADEIKPPSNEHLNNVVENYTPVQPPAAIQDGFQDEFQQGILDISKGIYDEVLDEYKGEVLDSIQDTAKEMSKDYYNQALIDYKKGGSLLQDATTDRNSYKYFIDNDFMDATNQKYSDAWDLLDSGSNKVFKGDVAHLVDAGLEVYNVVGDCVGLAGDVVTIVDDVKALGDLKHEHSSWKAVEATLLVTDIGLTAVGIGATLGLVTLGPAVGAALMVGGVVVGISSAFVHSDAFADYMNSTDGSLQSFLEGLFPWTKTPNGVNCYKPNIYIYDKEGRRIQVIFTAPELLLVSIPEYEAGWTVDSSADGTLLTETGEEYDFLFYESHTVKDMFDTRSGFHIGAKDRQIQWENILAEYGFNEEEIADFIEFWNMKLDADKDYIMYPQYTETVDEAMPIIVAPYPENMVRIWFVFEEYRGQEYEEEQIVPFSREGYTVVEWGGMIF